MIQMCGVSPGRIRMAINLDMIDESRTGIEKITKKADSRNLKPAILSHIFPQTE